MSKSRVPNPKDPAGPPPERADVERAIESVLERLRPKGRRAPRSGKGDGLESGKPAAPRLSLVSDRDVEGR